MCHIFFIFQFYDMIMILIFIYFTQTDDKKTAAKPENLETDKNSTESKAANNNASTKVEKSCKWIGEQSCD